MAQSFARRAPGRRAGARDEAFTLAASCPADSLRGRVLCLAVAPAPSCPVVFAILRANVAFFQLTIARAWPGVGPVGMATRCEGH